MKKVLKDIWLNVVCSSVLLPPPIRIIFYKFMHYNIRGYICAGCFCGYGKGILCIGKGSSVNYNCFFDLGADITIGDNCNISYQVTFVNSSHEIGSADRRAKGGFAKPIVVGNGCWIGANVTIMPGVTIGEGCIIGTGTLVTKDCEPNGVYVGIPAKRIKNLE